MSRVATEELTRPVSRAAAAAVRIVVPSGTDRPAVLSRFWYLQDTFAWLLDAVSDDPREFSSVLGKLESKIITDIADVIGITAELPVAKIPAVEYSCKDISELLTKLLQQARAMTVHWS